MPRSLPDWKRLVHQNSRLPLILGDLENEFELGEGVGAGNRDLTEFSEYGQLCDGIDMRTWKVVDYGQVPLESERVPYDCPHCGVEASLPVVGRVLAQLAGGGLVFDIGPRALPQIIHCRSCRRTFTQEEPQGVR